MKQCPYCREEVRDDAIKCRYCSSSLTPAQASAEQPTEQPADRSNRVVFIVDNDLVRFAKFVAGVLAIFVTIGASLYGFSINQAADKVRESGDKVRDLGDKIRDLADSVRVQKEAVDSQAKAIEITAQQIRKAKDDVDNQTKTVEATAREISETATQVASDRQRVKDLRKQAEEDALKTHTVFIRMTSNEPANSNAASIKSVSPFTVPELARLYNFPTEFDGKGQTIALIELGGGFLDSDLSTYFKRLKVAKPKVTTVSVGGVRNEPRKDFGANTQVTLDIEVVGAAAPGADIVVYFSSSTHEGFLNAINQAVHDNKAHPTIILINWGGPEETWTSIAMQAINAALQEAAQRGITVIVAAGDTGITDEIKDGKHHVDFPASSPYALAVGGSHLSATKEKGAIISETVRRGSGGGVSAVFPRPQWQETANPRTDGGGGRGIPDVAINADVETGYIAVINGSAAQIGGTSAGAALWAGLIARINQGVGYNIGYINPVLYEKLGPSGALRSIANAGDLKGDIAGSGWNGLTGWGSPDGRKLLKAFQNLPSPRGESSAR